MKIQIDEYSDHGTGGHLLDLDIPDYSSWLCEEGFTVEGLVTAVVNYLQPFVGINKGMVAFGSGFELDFPMDDEALSRLHHGIEPRNPTEIREVVERIKQRVGDKVAKGGSSQ